MAEHSRDRNARRFGHVLPFSPRHLYAVASRSPALSGLRRPATRQDRLIRKPPYPMLLEKIVDSLAKQYLHRRPLLQRELLQRITNVLGDMNANLHPVATRR